MNVPFQMMNMPVVTSQYWNIVYGLEEGQAAYALYQVSIIFMLLPLRFCAHAFVSRKALKSVNSLVISTLCLVPFMNS